jgi:uncharacterized delta-60 repeat protein
MQPDGKFIIAGSFTTFNGLPQNRLIRLNSDGSKDLTFDVGVGIPNLVTTYYPELSVKIQSDGKIIINGPFISFNGGNENGIVRLNSDGSKDSSFNVGNAFVIGAQLQHIKIELQQDNKILAFGNFAKYNDEAQNGFVRINLNGSKDESFLLGKLGFNDGAGVEVGGIDSSGVSTLCLQPDGKILVGGNFNSFNGITENRLIRLNPDGKKDLTFDIRLPTITDLTLTGFNSYGIGTIAVQSDGKILAGGWFTKFNNLAQNRLIRLNSDGSKDNTFNIGTGFNAAVTSIIVQSDGKILVGGTFSSFNGIIKYGLVRLNSDGTIDTTFNTTLGQTNTSLIMAIQPDGKIIIGRQYGTQSQLLRLNSDGSNDVFFNVGTGLNSGITKIVIQPDNKILIGGSFTTYNGISQISLIRFNTDGSKDLSFNVGGTGFSGAVYDIAIQSDNKIVLAGGFSSYNDIYQKALIRINLDGSVDNSLLFGDTISSKAFRDGLIYSIAIKSNGNIFVGGPIRNYFNYASSGLVGIRGNAVLSNENFEITNNEITLFPNPVDNVLNFKTSNFNNISKVSIYDLVGNQILKDKNVINYNIDISNLSKGIYLIKMTTTNNEIIIKKIIKN